jgi:hypothetical protein
MPLALDRGGHGGWRCLLLSPFATSDRLVTDQCAQ